MKIYISGRIKDYHEYKEHFAKAAYSLSARGYETVNPCELGDPSLSYEEFMRVDLKALLDCDAIFMLEGWEISVGARTEHLVAAMCNLKIYYEKAMLL